MKHVLQLFHKHDWSLNRRIVLWISNLALDDEGSLSYYYTHSVEVLSVFSSVWEQLQYFYAVRCAVVF